MVPTHGHQEILKWRLGSWLRTGEYSAKTTAGQSEVWVGNPFFPAPGGPLWSLKYVRERFPSGVKRLFRL